MIINIINCILLDQRNCPKIIKLPIVPNMFESRVDDTIGLIVVIASWLILITSVSPVSPINVCLPQVLDSEIPPFVLSVLPELA